jgi:ATP-dependent Clp protease ATP-binding subunit ClpC
MAPELKGKVIGQDDAVSKIVRSIQRSRIGLADPNKPIFVGMLIGNSGVGKCIAAETLVKLRNKKTGNIEEIDINNLIYKISGNDPE